MQRPTHGGVGGLKVGAVVAGVVVGAEVGGEKVEEAIGGIEVNVGVEQRIPPSPPPHARLAELLRLAAVLRRGLRVVREEAQQHEPHDGGVALLEEAEEKEQRLEGELGRRERKGQGVVGMPHPLSPPATTNVVAHAVAARERLVAEGRVGLRRALLGRQRDAKEEGRKGWGRAGR